VHLGIDKGLVVEKEWPQKRLVQMDGSLSLRREQPDEETELHRPIERDVMSESVGEGLEKREEGKDGPIRQPLSVIVLVGGFDRLETPVRRSNESDEVANEAGAKDEVNDDPENGDHAQGDEALLDSRFLLQISEELELLKRGLDLPLRFLHLIHSTQRKGMNIRTESSRTGSCFQGDC